MFKNLAQTLKRFQVALLPVFSGTLLVVIFPRFNLELFAWLALVPLFFAIRNQSLNRATYYGFLTGMVFYSFGLHWVTNTMVNYGHLPVWLSYLILLLLAAYLSLYLALFCRLTLQWSRGNDLYFFLLAPVIWTSLEYIRSAPAELGFSWLGLGYSQFKNLPVIQMAEYTGVYGISWLIVFLNAAIYLFLKNRLAKGSPELPQSLVRILGVTATVLVLWWGYGFYALNRLANEEPREPLRIALAQGNIEQYKKWNPEFRDEVFTSYSRLTLQAAESKPDLIVWPEAAIPFIFDLESRETKQLRALVQSSGAPLLFGAPHQELRSGKRTYFNRAYLLSPEGVIAGHYDKIHLVPFGEYVPFKEVLGFVEKMVVGVGDFGRGTETTVFDVRRGRFGVSICYEITFPDLVRRSVKAGAGFLVNITNDAWFGKSAASYQHMSMGALRAVENRVPIVRAANTGISGTIDPSGRMRQTTGLFTRALVTTEIVPRPGSNTYYSNHGDVFCWLSLFLTGGLALLAARSLPEN